MWMLKRNIPPWYTPFLTNSTPNHTVNRENAIKHQDIVHETAEVHNYSLWSRKPYSLLFFLCTIPSQFMSLTATIKSVYIGIFAFTAQHALWLNCWKWQSISTCWCVGEEKIITLLPSTKLRMSSPKLATLSTELQQLTNNTKWWIRINMHKILSSW